MWPPPPPALSEAQDRKEGSRDNERACASHTALPAVLGLEVNVSPRLRHITPRKPAIQGRGLGASPDPQLHPSGPHQHPGQARDGVGKGLWGHGEGKGLWGQHTRRCKRSRDPALTVMQMVTSREAAADFHDNGRECHPPRCLSCISCPGSGRWGAAGAGVLPLPKLQGSAFRGTCDSEGCSHKLKRVN